MMSDPNDSQNRPPSYYLDAQTYLEQHQQEVQTALDMYDLAHPEDFLNTLSEQPSGDPRRTDPMSSLPYYVDDPLMDAERPKHRLELENEPVESARLGYAVSKAWCPCGWQSPGTYDWHGHAEAYDQHMRDVQQRIHADQGAPE